MSTKSPLRPLFLLVIGVMLTTSACAISFGEEEDGLALGASGIGHPEHADMTTNDANTTTTVDTEPTNNTGTGAEPRIETTSDSSGSIAAPVATSIPNIGQSTEPVDETPADQAVVETRVDETAFCDASADYWVTSNAFVHINSERPGEVSMLFKLMAMRLDEAIAVAPTQELAAPALLAQEHFSSLHDAVAEAGYDLDAFEAGSSFSQAQPSIQTLAEIENMLKDYLVGPCGLSAQTLEASTESIASSITQSVTEVVAPTTGTDYPGDYIEITDSTDRLKVEVPIDWEDVQSEPSGAGSALTIAPDVGAYLTTWKADGMKLTVSEASTPVDWRQPMYETNASSDCTLISSEPYRDSLYTGWIDRYDNCADGPASAVVVGATDETFALEILVEVQFDNIDTQNDQATLSQILDTFKAR